MKLPGWWPPQPGGQVEVATLKARTGAQDNQSSDLFPNPDSYVAGDFTTSSRWLVNWSRSPNNLTELKETSVQCYCAQQLTQSYPLEIPIFEETINVITRLVLCSQPDDIYW